jgi:RNA polymerase II C-terminal domain phosphatase-like 3/4
MEILQGCHIVFSWVFPLGVKPEEQEIWKLAEEMGARCYSAVDDSVTHVVATADSTVKAVWAIENNKFLVNPWWIDGAHYLWQRQKEEDFPVSGGMKTDEHRMLKKLRQ